jgi:hypothetical protein
MILRTYTSIQTCLGFQERIIYTTPGEQVPCHGRGMELALRRLRCHLRSILLCRFPVLYMGLSETGAYTPKIPTRKGKMIL